MKPRVSILILLPLGFLLIVSCASNWPKDFGSYTQDEKIKAMFEAHEYNP